MFSDLIETILALTQSKLYKFNSDIGVNYNSKFYKIVSLFFNVGFNVFPDDGVGVDDGRRNKKFRRHFSCDVKRQIKKTETNINSDCGGKDRDSV